MKKRKDWRPARKIFSQENLARISLNNISWLRRLRYSFPAKNVFQIEMTMYARDRDSGIPRRLYVSKQYYADRIKSSRQILEAVRAVAKYGLQHEVDECLYFDNKRIFDPHK